MEYEGWQPLWRKTLNNDIWRYDNTAWKVFEALLLLCDHRTGTWKGGRFQLASICNVNPNTLYSALKRLEKAKMITLTSNTRYTEVSIKKFGEYGVGVNTKRQQPINNQSTTNQHSNKHKALNTKKDISIPNGIESGIAIPDSLDKAPTDKSGAKINTTAITEKDRQLARDMMATVWTNYPYLKPKKQEDVAKTLLRTADSINKLNRIDGHDYQLIEAVMRWALQDDFWKRNIQSGDKLRKQFATRLMVEVHTKVNKQASRVLEV